MAAPYPPRVRPSPLRQLSATLRPDTTRAAPSTMNWITRAPSIVAPEGDNAASMASSMLLRSSMMLASAVSSTSGGRYSSDVMHELAHLLLGHQPSTMFFAANGDVALRGYDGSAEEEANWLAAALLLPREALVWARKSPPSSQEICELYGVSNQMLSFRTSVTGIDRQFRRGRKPATQKR